MHQHMSNFNSKLDKTMNTEQFEQVVEAILAGKYSWACVLILRFAGYNPLHYIPYRTYNRLLKENSQLNRTQQHQSDATMGKSANSQQQNHGSPEQSGRKIKDLAYLEVMGKQKSETSGGSQQWREGNTAAEQEDVPFEIEPVRHLPFQVGKLL